MSDYQMIPGPIGLTMIAVVLIGLGVGVTLLFSWLF